MRKTEHILLELFETYPQATTGDIVERTGLARRTIQKYLTLNSMPSRSCLGC